jgi:hypothetical protein
MLENEIIDPNENIFDPNVPVASEPQRTPEEEARLEAEIARMLATTPGEETVKSAEVGKEGTNVTSVKLNTGTPVSGVSDDVARVINAQAEAIAALRAELEAVRAEAQNANRSRPGDLLNENASPGGYPWMYYRIPQNWPDATTRGWVTIGPGGPGHDGRRDVGTFARYLKKGLRPIEAYGYITVPTKTDATESFLPMLQKGGAKEFPCSQVIAYKWHIRPPIPGLKFPQYEANKSNVKRMTCEACGLRLYFMASDRNAGNFYRAHLQMAHKYPFRDAAEAITRAGFDLAPFFEEIADAEESQEAFTA